MSPESARLFELLRELSFARRAITLASGRTSHFYVDVRNTALHPEGATLLGRALLALLDTAPEVRAVAGPSIGADPLVTSIAIASHTAGRAVPALMVRPEAKAHGTGQRVEGMRNVPVGSAVAVVEDVITSGGSALRTIAALREAGLEPVCVLAVIDRQEGGREAIGLPVQALFTKSDFGVTDAL